MIKLFKVMIMFLGDVVQGLSWFCSDQGHQYLFK